MIISTKKSNPFYVEFPSCAMNFIIFLEIILIYIKAKRASTKWVYGGRWLGGKLKAVDVGVKNNED
jgi:hypothetical protein